jgi:hypothetical protein
MIKLLNVYSSRDIRAITSRRLKWVGHAAHTGWMRSYWSENLEKTI